MKLLVVFTLLCATSSFAIINEEVTEVSAAFLRPLSAYVGADNEGYVWTCTPSIENTIMCVKIPANLFTTCSFEVLNKLGVVAVTCEEFI